MSCLFRALAILALATSATAQTAADVVRPIASFGLCQWDGRKCWADKAVANLARDQLAIDCHSARQAERRWR